MLPDGYRVVYKHERRYRVVRAKKMSETDRTIMDPRGGTTHCKILDPLGNIVIHTVARCRPNEGYVKSLGRTIAGGRAQIELNQLIESEAINPTGHGDGQ
jgi:hypothetical protein